VTFTDTSTGGPTSWAWDFQNDGTVDSTAQNQIFTFTDPGTYDVKLTVTNSGGSSNVVQTAAVTVAYPAYTIYDSFSGAPQDQQLTAHTGEINASWTSPSGYHPVVNPSYPYPPGTGYAQFTYATGKSVGTMTSATGFVEVGFSVLNSNDSFMLTFCDSPAIDNFFTPTNRNAPTVLFVNADPPRLEFTKSGEGPAYTYMTYNSEVKIDGTLNRFRLQVTASTIDVIINGSTVYTMASTFDLTGKHVSIRSDSVTSYNALFFDYIVAGPGNLPSPPPTPMAAPPAPPPPPPPPPPPAPPPGAAPSATLITLPYSASVPLDSNLKWYKFVLSATATVTMSTLNSPDTNGDTFLALYDSAGNGLQENDDSGARYLSEIVTSLSAGTYYLGLTYWPGNVNSGWNLTGGSVAGSDILLEVS
jgi:PKD repeat protein